MATQSEESKIRVNDNTLTKEEQRELLWSILPSCQPQEGSPANTFTKSELDDLKTAFPEMQIGPSSKSTKEANKLDILKQWEAPPQDGSTEAPPQDGCDETECDASTPQDEDFEADWHGAPRFHKQASLARAFREKVRNGEFTGPTNGVCPGFLQCNLVVLPQGPVAFDFLLFCQRNPKACPLIDVCDVGSPHAPGVAKGADLRTDVPK
jgi:hypothetical protein